MRLNTPSAHPAPVPPRGSDRPRPIAVGLALVAVIGMPIVVYTSAIHTSIGPIVFVFAWSEGEGIHTGDLVILLLALPVWFLGAATLVKQALTGKTVRA